MFTLQQHHVYSLLNITIQSVEFGSARPRKQNDLLSKKLYHSAFSHKHTEALPRSPQQLVIKVGQTHLHAMIHVADIQLPSSSSQIAPRSGSIRGSRTTQKHEAQSRAKFPWQWSGRRDEWWQSEQLKNKRAEWGDIMWLCWERRGWKGVGDTPGSTFSASCFVRCRLSVSNPVHWHWANGSGCREGWRPAGTFPSSLRFSSRTHFGNPSAPMDKLEWSTQNRGGTAACHWMWVLRSRRVVGTWTSFFKGGGVLCLISSLVSALIAIARHHKAFIMLYKTR